MALRLKLCFMFSLIYLCQFVQSNRLNKKKNSICSRSIMVYYESTGYRIKNEKYCCDGYSKDTRYLYTLKCDPVCNTGCPNGKCVAPQTCQCKGLYCGPRCNDYCYNGDCVSSNICRCKPGFRALNDTYCEPIPSCSPSCFNGECVGKNKCKCHDGYELSGWVPGGFDYTCLPHTTSTTTSRTETASIDDAEVTTTEVTDQVQEVTDQGQMVTDQGELVTDQGQLVTDQSQLVTDQDALTKAEVTEFMLTDFASDDGNEIDNSETTVADGNMTVIVDEKNGTKMWTYVSATISLVAVVVLLVAFRRKLLGCIKGKSYKVRGQQTRRASASSNTFNVTFSSPSSGK